MRKVVLVTVLLAAFGLNGMVYAQAVAKFSPRTDSAGRAQSMIKLAQGNIDYYTRTFTYKGLKPEARERMHLERCQAYLILKKFEKAIDDCAAALAINPRSTRAYVTRANIYNRINNDELAIADYKKAILYTTTNDSKAQLYDLIARSYITRREYAKAVSADSTAIVLNPKLSVAYASRAYAYGRMGKFQLAIEDISIAMYGFQDNARTLSVMLTERADMKRALKQYKESVNDYSLALKLDPDNGVAYWNRAASYRENGDYQLAYDGYTKAISYYRNDHAQLARLYDDRALMEIGLQQYKQAIADDSVAISLDTAFGAAYYNKANARAQNGEYARSNTEFMKAMSYFINNPLAIRSIYCSMAHNEYFLGDYQTAITYGTKAIAFNSADWSPYFERARAYLKMDNKDLAQNDFKEVLVRDTSKQSADYAFSLFYTGKPDKAVEIMQSSFLKTTDTFVLMGDYYNMACLFSLMNKPDDANNYLKKCIEGGYNKKYALTDGDFDNIRNTAEFKNTLGIK